MKIGIDTGFWVEFLRGNEQAKSLWNSFLTDQNEAVCSAITLFEIEKLGLRGVFDKILINRIIERLMIVCNVVWIDNRALISSAANLSHGLGIPAADAMILACFLKFECLEIYTTDKHLEAYQKKGVKIINLKI